MNEERKKEKTDRSKLLLLEMKEGEQTKGIVSVFIDGMERTMEDASRELSLRIVVSSYVQLF